jgi:uncharacterized protein (TIRG00374 family)
MKIAKALIGFLLLSIFYLAILIWADSENQALSLLPRLALAIPVLMGISLCSYFFRYLRWRWLLRRSGYPVAWSYGFISYIAGFAFTATPGKVGELIRIRYFTKVGVPQNISFGAFVYERALDLIVVLVLASLAISRKDLLVIAIIFVLIFIVLLVIVASNSKWLTRVSTVFKGRSWFRLEKIALTIRDGLTSCRSWFTPLDLAVSMGLGLAAWGMTSYAFMWLLNDLAIPISPLAAFTIYPLAMLAGAASMLPGGVGSTELTIVILLGFYGVTSATAVLAAVGIRFATIWFSVLVGFSCIGLLEIKLKN